MVVVDTAPPGVPRKQVRKTFHTERDARTFLAETQAEVAKGTYVAASSTTVRQAVTDWLDTRQVQPTTLASYTVVLQALADERGDVPLQKLSEADVVRTVRRLRAGESPGRKVWKARSCNLLLTLTKAVLESEKRQGRVVRNVAADIRPMEKDAQTAKTLTHAQMLTVLDHKCRDQHLWTLALHGLRRGEIAGLRWENVDLDGKTISIVETRVAVGKDVQVSTPKSKQSRRTLPLPDDVVAVLKRARRNQRAERLAAGAKYESGAYVACDELGAAYHPDKLSRDWRAMLADLDIGRVRLHDARHTCGTLMHLRGVPITVIAAWLGHSSAAFTMATYTHSQDEALKAAGAMLTGRVSEKM
ncbi:MULTISPECIES: site-specific integrase [Gordonia]|uniref:site-specific integrase n=1 Tax=Gordonia TaxID=2053 RepID=UPI0012FACA40|nr:MULTISPECIES: site-specific integrase [Gordonia]